MKSLRQFYFPRRLVTLLLTVGWLVWTMSPANAQVKRKIVFGVPVTPPNVIHISPYIANDMGFFAEQGIEADMVTFEGGVGTVRGSVSGGLDITATSADPAINAAAKGAGIKVIGSYSHRLSQSMLVQGDIKSCKDLKGRKVAIQELGGFSDVYCQALSANMLGSAETNSNDTRIIYSSSTYNLLRFTREYLYFATTLLEEKKQINSNPSTSDKTNPADSQANPAAHTYGGADNSRENIARLLTDKGWP